MRHSAEIHLESSAQNEEINLPAQHVLGGQECVVGLLGQPLGSLQHCILVNRRISLHSAGQLKRFLNQVRHAMEARGQCAGQLLLRLLYSSSSNTWMLCGLQRDSVAQQFDPLISVNIFEVRSQEEGQHLAAVMCDHDKVAYQHGCPDCCDHLDRHGGVAAMVHTALKTVHGHLFLYGHAIFWVKG